MSLIHWWPLNGNLKDLGVGASATTSGTASYGTGGKIGANCLNTSNSIQFTDTKFNGVRVWSVCFWGYVISASVVNNWTGLFHITDGSSNIRVEVCPSTYSSGRYCYSLHNNSGNAIFSSSIAAPTGGFYDQWTHFAIVCDGSYVSTYANGTKLGSIAYNGSGTITGTFKLLNNHIVKKNDFRIYDHALSQKEIKEISKGLVLHYNFEDPYAEGTTNLFAGRTDFSNTSHWPRNQINSTAPTVDSEGNMKLYGYATDGNHQSYTFSKNAGYTSISASTTYTLSVWVKYSSTSAYFNMYFYEQNSSGSATKTNSWRIGCTSEEVGHWVLRSKTVTTQSTTTRMYAELNCYNCPASDYIIMKNNSVQLEQKDHATPYVNGTRQPGLIYDSSGYGYNGTPYGNTLQIVSDSRIGNKCAKFDNTINSAIVCGNGMFVKDELTVNWWGYMSSWSSYGRAISCTEGGGWNFEPNSSKMGFPVYLSGIGYKSAVSTTTLANLSAGWHMFTGTYDGYTVKIYIDGVLEGSISSGASSKTAIGYPNNGLFIGSEAAGTATTPTSPYFNGNMADVKIYATALSQQDIISEYDRRISIDRNGNFYSDEFVEEDGANTSVDKTGVTNTNVIATTMTLDDGSIWIPICMHYVPDGLNSGNSNKYIYTSRNIWNTFGIINDAERPESGYYEFYVMQQTAINGAFSWFRFKQNINPFSATWNDVNPSKVGTNVTRISASTTNSYAGMYWMNTSNIAMCFANTSNGNWFGCGARANWHSGTNDIPGYNGQAVLGWQIVYMRVTKTCAKMFKNGLVIANNIIEN